MGVHINSQIGIETARTLGVTGKQSQIVITALLEKSPQTRNELSESTGLLVSSLCGRINELKKAGLIYAPCSKRGHYRVPNEAYSLTEKALKTLSELQVA